LRIGFDKEMLTQSVAISERQDLFGHV
jgi:hypothetical protein